MFRICSKLPQKLVNLIAWKIQPSILQATFVLVAVIICSPVTCLIEPCFTGDDDRPEIIELSDFNPAEPQFALCAKVSSQQEYENQDYSGQRYRGFSSSEYASTQEYPVGEYPQGYNSEYVHEHDYHQLPYPETNLSEGEGYNNEDSVSEVNLSDGNIPKMKLDEVRLEVSDK